MPLEELLAKYRSVSDTEHLFCLTHICSCGPGFGVMGVERNGGWKEGRGIRKSFVGCVSGSEQSLVIVMFGMGYLRGCLVVSYSGVLVAGHDLVGKPDAAGAGVPFFGPGEGRWG